MQFSEDTGLEFQVIGSLDLSKSLRELLAERHKERRVLSEPPELEGEVLFTVDVPPVQDVLVVTDGDKIIDYWPTPKQHKELLDAVADKMEENVMAAVREDLECLSK